MRAGWRQIGLAIIVISGCAPNTNNREPVVMPQTSDSALSELIGKPVSIEGVLEGNWIRQRSGKVLGPLAKGTHPLSIKYGTRSLPIVGNSEELEKKLVERAGQTVQLQGTIDSAESPGRGDIGGQAGYRGPIPDHRVYFLIVTACKSMTADTP